MSRRAFLRAAIALAGVAAIPPIRASAATEPMQQLFFPETGHNISPRFRRFYERYGGLELFGLPLTEMINDNGLFVQYFERARFEWRTDLAGGVTLSLLGTELVQGRTEPEFQWLAGPPTDQPDQQGIRFFVESGHTLRGAFADFWDRKGGLVVFGFPISEELTETGADGVPRTVQYFQRARFELHPEYAFTASAIQLGHLGRQAFERRGDLGYAAAPAAPVNLLGTAVTGFRGSSYERRTNIMRAAALFDGREIAPREEFSFIRGHDFSEESGFVEGYGIVGGKIDRVIGGGLCQVSTTLFRAVANAGLEITRRVPHTYVVYFYENIIGFDATVFTPDVDFRWRNDSATPVTIIADVDLQTERVAFDLLGISDGRQVSYQGPQVSNRVEPGVAIWQFDPELARGERRQLVHGRAGVDVMLVRSVTRSGRIIRQDKFDTKYKPWADFWAFGPGVEPPAGVRVIR